MVRRTFAHKMIFAQIHDDSPSANLTPSSVRRADHMTVMARVQSGHFNFAVSGFGIGIMKRLKVKRSWQLALARL
jgi:hypothetical protein